MVSTVDPSNPSFVHTIPDLGYIDYTYFNRFLGNDPHPALFCRYHQVFRPITRKEWNFLESKIADLPVDCRYHMFNLDFDGIHIAVGADLLHENQRFGGRVCELECAKCLPDRK